MLQLFKASPGAGDKGIGMGREPILLLHKLTDSAEVGKFLFS